VVEKLTSYSAQLPRMFELGLVLMLAWMVSSWWQADTLDGIELVNLKSEMKDDSDVLHVSEFADVALFGSLVKKAIVEKLQAKPKPVIVSKLNLKLLATVVAGKRSAAIVSLNNTKQQAFFLGDAMLSGVVLKQVEAAAIVVDNHGRLERIILPKSKSIKGISVKPVNTSRNQVLSRKTLNADMRNFPKLLSQAKVVPYFAQGKSAGFVIMEIVKGSLYQRIGLKNGDVIQKVNGQAITSTSQAMKMYQNLQHASSIDLELMRHGTIVPIHYEIK